MQIKRFTILLSIVALLAMTSCRSHRHINREKTPDSTTVSQSDTIRNQPNTSRVTTPVKPTYTPHYYTANFTCTAQGFSANGQMRLQSDSVIWISASKIVELGRAKLTPDSVIVYAKVVNRCFAGNYDDLYQRFKFRTTFKQLYKRVSSPDAEAQLEELFKRFGVEAELKLAPLKEVESLTFPFSVPKKVNQL